jgi:hypothetical protein
MSKDLLLEIKDYDSDSAAQSEQSRDFSAFEWRTLREQPHLVHIGATV